MDAFFSFFASAQDKQRAYVERSRLGLSMDGITITFTSVGHNSGQMSRSWTFREGMRLGRGVEKNGDGDFGERELLWWWDFI